MLHVITCVSNPVLFKSRVELYRKFQEQMRFYGVDLITVELCYGDLEPQVAGGYGDHVLVRLPNADTFWHKENLLNIGVAYLSAKHWDWNKVAFIDADIQFTNPNWVHTTEVRLEHFHVLQLFTHAQDMGPNYEPLLDQPARTGFVYSWWKHLPDNHKIYGGYWHPGYAWAMGRYAYEGLGGLMDFPILGSADFHMAHAYIGTAEKTISRSLTPAYKERVLAWQERARFVVQREIFYVDGTINHAFHGKKVDRQYGDRWVTLAEHRFNPNTDITYNFANNGLLQWSHMNDPRLQELRDDVRRYFASRHEDSIDVR